MQMTLQKWDAQGCPGRFSGPGFYCWKTPSLLSPNEDDFHLVITLGGYRHPFKDKYADPTHLFGSFHGLRQYLGKSPAEIEGEVDLTVGPSLPPIDPRAMPEYFGLKAIAERFADEIRANMRKESVFLMGNHHDVSCGAPPTIDDTNSEQRRYYFENAHGDQLIFVFDRPSRTGSLYSGALGWTRVVPVIEGAVDGVTLSAVEQNWLKACWKAATQR